MASASASTAGGAAPPARLTIWEYGALTGYQPLADTSADMQECDAVALLQNAAAHLMVGGDTQRRPALKTRRGRTRLDEALVQSMACWVTARVATQAALTRQLPIWLANWWEKECRHLPPPLVPAPVPATASSSDMVDATPAMPAPPPDNEIVQRRALLLRYAATCSPDADLRALAGRYWAALRHCGRSEASHILLVAGTDPAVIAAEEALQRMTGLSASLLLTSNAAAETRWQAVRVVVLTRPSETDDGGNTDGFDGPFW